MSRGRTRRSSYGKYPDPAILPPTGPCPEEGKLAFSSRRLAKQAMRRFQATGDARPAGTRLHVYRCACGRFHIGHQHAAVQAGVLHRSDIDW